MTKLTHLDDTGQAHMVRVDGKPETHRRAEARGRIVLRPETIELIRRGDAKKGDVLGAARIAAIGAVKRTSDLIPLCHPLRVTSVEVSFAEEATAIAISVIVEAVDRSGVEMEALTGVTVAALTLYDMVKAVDREARITDVELWQKSGGKSGDWRRTA